MKSYLALTIIADDVPGVVERIADVVMHSGGNWTESSMSRLAGKFAGILLVEVPSAHQAELTAALEALAGEGIKVTVEPAGESESEDPGEILTMSLMANDRIGIVEEITAILAGLKVNVEQLHTHCENAPMSAVALFRASARIHLPPGLHQDDLQASLEDLSGDIMVELDVPE